MLPVLIVCLLAQAPEVPPLSRGRALVKALQQGDAGAVWAARGPGLSARFSSPDAVARFAGSVRGFGAEARVISEGLFAREGHSVYRRVMAVANYARGLTVEVWFDERGRVSNLVSQLPARAAPTTAGAWRTQATLRLPVDGPWLVLWGGRTWDDNRHAAVSDMRYALDLLVKREGSSSRGKGTRNEDYHAWRQPVLAPGAGRVVVAQDGVPDNLPNRPVPGNLYGNHVVIDHGTGEYSLLAHLQRGSVKVKPGQVVTAGQLLARCGNSGMSTEPHVHYHLMDHPDWRKAQGLPAQFALLLRNGQLVERAEPRRGEVVEPAAVEARR